MVKAPELGTKFRHSIHLSSQNAAAALIYFLFLLLHSPDEYKSNLLFFLNLNVFYYK